MKKNPSLTSQATAIFIGRFVGTVLQFFIPALLVRLISQEDFGIFRQFQLIAGTFIGVLGMGYNSSLYYFYPITNFKGRQKIIQQTEFLYVINLIFFSCIIYFFGDSILTYLNFTEFIEMKNLIVLFVTFLLLSSLLNYIFTLEKNNRLNQIYPGLERIAKFLIFILTVSIIPGFKGAIIALIIFSIAKLTYFMVHMRPYFKNIYALDYDLLKKQLQYSLPFGFALILNIVASKFDKFFINQYITPKEFGIYSIAFLGIPILKTFFQSINNVIVPKVSVYLTQGNMKDAISLWQSAVEKTSSLTIPAVILFWLLAEEIITILYTEAYIEAANYYRIFILIFLVSMFSYNIILRASNKTKYILMGSIFGAIITVIIGFLIIPRIGLYGAIITALIGSITPILISLHIERKIMGLSIRKWVNWKKLFTNFLISFLIGLPLFLLKDNIENLYIRFIVVSVIFSILIVFFQIKLKLFIFEKQISFITKFIKI